MKISYRIIVIFVVCLFTFSAYAGEKVAVLDFKSILASEELGTAVAEILRTELVGLGNYTVIERGMLEQVMQEQSLQLTGAVESETAVKIGKLVGAKLVVIGSIVKTGSVYTINARFIDVETGIVKVGQNIRGEGEDQISNMVHQLALIITGKTVITEETSAAKAATPTPEPTQPSPPSPGPGFPPQPGRPPKPGVPPQPGPPQEPGFPQEETPLLFSFENQEQIQQWQSSFKSSSAIHLSQDHATNGTHALQVILSKSDDWQEIHTTNIPADWSVYRIFAFDLYNNAKPSDEVWPLVVRIDDDQTTPIKRNWFAREYPIGPGATTIRIYIEDLGQKQNVRRIRQVMLTTKALPQDVEVYLDSFRFESIVPPAPTTPFSFSFETALEARANWQPTQRFIRLSPSNQHATQGESALQLELPRKLPNNQYPGIVSSAFPRDWSNYKQFAADIYYDQKGRETVTLGVRIDDAAETRFTWDMALQPGANKISLPVATIAKAIDISRIQAVYIFLVEPTQRTTLYLDNIRVE